MTLHSVAAIVLAAGAGTRMASDLPKPLHPIAGRPLIGHVLDRLAPLAPDPLVVIGSPNAAESLRAAVAPHSVAVQERAEGTADAVKAAREALSSATEGTVLIAYGDTPFIETDTFRAMLARRDEGAAVVVLGFRPKDTANYGRLVLEAGSSGAESGDIGSNAAGQSALERIVEHRDASPEEKAIKLCNSGVMAVDAACLMALIDRIGSNNAKGEFYLTDIVAEAYKNGLSCAVVEGEEDEMIGVDSRWDLARAEAIWQNRRRLRAMEEGASLVDPETVWFSHDTVLGRDVVIEPNVVFGPGVAVEDGVRIMAFSRIEGAYIAAGAAVGPFVRLRPGTSIGAGARVGNFVEMKNAALGPRAKASHLSYIGDSKVGADANIGAGTITCNYDGFAKHRTIIGEGAFIGSNTALVAPVTIGDGAMVGAGSTVSRDVPEDALAVERAQTKVRPGMARTLRDRRGVAKAEKGAENAVEGSTENSSGELPGKTAGKTAGKTGGKTSGKTGAGKDGAGKS